MAKKTKLEGVKVEKTESLKVDNLTEEEFNRIIAIRIATDENLSDAENNHMVNELTKKIMIILINNTDVNLPPATYDDLNV